MLLGSVPSPPKKPKSSISIQSARQSAIVAMSVTRPSQAGPRPAATVTRPAPVAASAITANRLTANPFVAVKDAKPRTHPAMRVGCGVLAMALTMPVSVPGPPCPVPCQKPRPGQACSAAMPMKNAPATARIVRPIRAVAQLRSGRAIRTPGRAVEQHRAGRAE